MKIEDKKVVLITYEVEVEGKVVDSATEEKPLDYIQGTHMIIPMLEACLEGKSEGDGYAVTIPPLPLRKKDIQQFQKHSEFQVHSPRHPKAHM